MMTASADADLLARVWTLLGGGAEALDAVTFVGPRHTLPSVFDVDTLASASVAAAVLAVAELGAARRDAALPAVTVDRVHAALAFRSERYLEPLGWELPPVWDPIAGDYRAADGWIRLHTNYASHREAALSVLQVPGDRDAVAAAVARWSRTDLEGAVLAAGGCAAALHTTADWHRHPQGAAVGAEPLLHVEGQPVPGDARPAGAGTPADSAAPLAGLRVLDLTRVIAGPVCGRLLAEAGAAVTRIDPPGFEEVPVVLADTAARKVRLELDLGDDEDREVFEGLVRTSDALVHGYRGGAFAALGYTTAALRRLNPALVVASLDAYGFHGPWAGRRGFDSLVQMSTGIAGRQQQLAGAPEPRPLPAQALDHATGYLLAAGVARSLTTVRRHGIATEVRASLARTAHELLALGEHGDPSCPEPDPATVEAHLVGEDTPWGSVRRIRSVTSFISPS